MQRQYSRAQAIKRHKVAALPGMINNMFACWFQPAQTSQPTVFSSHKIPAPASPNRHQHQPANRPKKCGNPIQVFGILDRQIMTFAHLLLVSTSKFFFSTIWYTGLRSFLHQKKMRAHVAPAKTDTPDAPRAHVLFAPNGKKVQKMLGTFDLSGFQESNRKVLESHNSIQIK